MFHGRPYGTRAGPTMGEGNSANASQLRSLATDFTLNYFFFIIIIKFQMLFPLDFQRNPFYEIISKVVPQFLFRLVTVGTEI